MDPVFNAGCGHPVVPANTVGTVTYGIAINVIFPMGTRSDLYCKTGYTPLGSPSYCQPHGSWKPDYTCASNKITSFHTFRIGFCIFLFNIMF